MPPSKFSPSSASRSAHPAWFAWLVLSGLALAVSGCAEDDTAEAVAPAGPPVLGVAALRPAGGPETSPDTASTCVSLGADPKRTITILLTEDLPSHPGTIKNWSLEPPFACIGTPQCGYVLITVDAGQPGGFTVASVGVSVDVPMALLPEPTGDHTILVELRNSDGSRARDARGRAYQVTLPLRVAATCGDALVDAGVRDGSLPPLEDSGSRDASSVPVPDGATRDGSPPGDASRKPDASPPDARIPIDSGSGGAAGSGGTDSGARDG